MRLNRARVDLNSYCFSSSNASNRSSAEWWSPGATLSADVLSSLLGKNGQWAAARCQHRRFSQTAPIAWVGWCEWRREMCRYPVFFTVEGSGVAFLIAAVGNETFLNILLKAFFFIVEIRHSYTSVSNSLKSLSWVEKYDSRIISIQEFKILHITKPSG